MADNTGLILLATSITVASAEYASVAAKKGFVMKPVIAGFILGGMLYVVSGINSSLGAAFCALVIVASLLINGKGLISGLTSLTATKATTTVKPPTK